MYWDRFDICEAYYLFFADYHEGQGSEKYRRLCQLTRPGFFSPSPLLNLEGLNENARAIYDALVERETA